MAKNSTPATSAPVAIYAGKLPSTKRPGEMDREKVVRRLLRAAKALDAARLVANPRPGYVEGFEKKLDGCKTRLVERMTILVAAGESGAPGEWEWKTGAKPVDPTEFEKAAFAIAGYGAPAKVEKAKAPARRKAPAKTKAPEAETAAETATAE